MSDLVRTPWTPDQVASLNEYQTHDQAGHPFTCGERTADGEHHVLRATETGWVCDICAGNGKEYHQDWCHDFMCNWSWKPWAEQLKNWLSRAK